MATREQVDELKSKMATQRAELIAAARSLSREDSLRVPVDAEGEEQWTALEQLAHLWEMERAYDAWVLRALHEENPDLAGTAPSPVEIPIESANLHTVEDLVDALIRERLYTEGIIDAIRLDDFERTAVSPVFGQLTVLQWVRSFYRHDRQHAAQVQGRKSDYQPNFKTKEPNQRQARLDLVARRRA
ncbi:MAG: DinB family protein [Dehalococcoidia bacterium]|nr:DinB family protein [Dehalococcoidia bacterium]